MKSIKVEHLKKNYKVPQKDPGFIGSVKSLVNRKYKTVNAVKDISFEIEEGELIGFIGPNGAGKTTTLKMLSGLLHPTSGMVDVLGFKPYERKSAFLKQISLVMGQKNQLWWDLPATDTFLLNKEIYQISDQDYKRITSELFELMDISDFIQTPVRNLSLGQRMKCELIASLIHKPKVLFLDEPTIGLDVIMQKNLREFVKEYNIRHNATILLTSHYMEDVKQLCKRVIVIDHGDIIYDGPLDDIIKKFSHSKEVTITFTKEIQEDDVKKLGKIKLFEKSKVVLEVESEEANRVVAHILDKLPVEDLTIHEPDIEDIIRDVFNNKVS